MKKKLLLSLLLTTALVSSCDLFDTTIDTIYDIDRYEEYVDRCWDPAKSFMPSLDSLTDYKEISVSLTSSSHKYGYSDTEPYGLILFVSYEEEIYESKKEEIEQTYTFIETPIMEYGKPRMTVIDLTYCEYRIRVVYNEDFIYPKSFGMIGTNDDIHTIAYLYYQNVDCNFVGFEDESTEEHINHFKAWILSEVFIFPEQ